MNYELSKAIRDRDAYLEKYPHLLDFQTQIDKSMANMNSLQRLDYLVRLLNEYLIHLKVELIMLQQDLEDNNNEDISRS